jgi:hypothetical protein
LVIVGVGVGVVQHR